MSFFSACDKKIWTKKKNLGLFESQSKMSQLENSFWRKMTNKTKQTMQKFFEFSSFDSQNCAKNSKNYLYQSKFKFSRLKLSLNKLLQLLTILLISLK